MSEAYIVAAARTATGRRNGRLAGVHPANLGGHILDALVDRSGVDPAAIDDVIMGCVGQVGEQGTNIGRVAVMASKLPDSVPATTVNRQCGSSLQALQFAAQAVMSGTQDLVIAAGVESMTRVPIGLAITLPAEHGVGEGPYPQNVLDRYGVQNFIQFTGAELMVRKYGYSRETLDRFALESHMRASRATRGGAFAAEIAPIDVISPDSGSMIRHEFDEGIRHDATFETIHAVKLLRPDGAITAATSSQIADGASGVLVASASAVRNMGLKPLARVHGFAVTAGDPVIMLDETIGATRRILKRAGMTIEDIDLYEVNEAFAPVPLSWAEHIGGDPARLNVNGGAIALGHPLGASGTRLMTTLLYALRARGKRWGLQTMCESGGLANAMIVEAL